MLTTVFYEWKGWSHLNRIQLKTNLGWEWALSNMVLFTINIANKLPLPINPKFCQPFHSKIMLTTLSLTTYLRTRHSSTLFETLTPASHSINLKLKLDVLPEWWRSYFKKAVWKYLRYRKYLIITSKLRTDVGRAYDPVLSVIMTKLRCDGVQ